MPKVIISQELQDFVRRKVEGRVVYVKQIEAYVVYIPVGWNGKEEIYNQKVFNSEEEIFKEFN